MACGPPPHQAVHRTGRATAKATGISLRSVQRIREAHQLQLHRIKTFMRSNDPAFEAKLADVIGLYVDPPIPSCYPSTKRGGYRRSTASSPACSSSPAVAAP